MASASGPGTSDGFPDTVFGKILRKEIPSSVVYEDDSVYAFNDIAPQAPVHVVVIPKVRDGLVGIQAAEDRHAAILGKLMLAASKVAKAAGVAEEGYRVVVNAGEHGCQTVDHIHLHVIGGKQLTWPPGTGAPEGSKTA